MKENKPENKIPNIDAFYFDKKPTEKLALKEEIQSMSTAWSKLENEQIQKTLDIHFRKKLNHKLSIWLEKNPYIKSEDYSMYTTVLEPYKGGWERFDEYDKKNPNNIKHDFIKSGNPNLGWKIHLNVEPKDVKIVSDYLINNGYNHKYLSGGDIEDGKTFTIYIGDYTLVSNLAKEISNDLKSQLRKPEAKSEVELAPGVVGRFVTQRKEFGQYGTCGFSIINNWVYDKRGFNATNINLIKNKETSYREQALREGEMFSYKELKKLYGNYFFKE